MPLGFGGGDTNLYAYVGNSPTNRTDPSGRWIETALDIASIAYDAQQLATSTTKDEFWLNAAFLGLDVVGLLIPGVTGLGLVGRVASKADNVDEIAELAMRSRSASGVPRTLENRLNPQRYIDEVAQLYGINLRGSGQSVQAIFDPTLPVAQNGVTRASEGGRVIRIGSSALADEATLANTIAHELSHARDYLRGGIHKPHGGLGAVADGTAYGAGNALEAWINGLR